MSEETIQQVANDYFVSVRFRKGDKSYSFSTNDPALAIGDVVIVETVEGYEAAIVGGVPRAMEYYHSPLELKPILRRANKADLQRIKLNEAYEKRALEVCDGFVKQLGLAMDLIDACYNLGGDKVTITYTSTEKRVDFRELLHLIVPTLSCRVELRQLASRDRARMIGGLGLCGLPLCCSTFLTSFEGISISRAKNQMLTLNIPKISGPCGKLICCLTFEDDVYTEAKKEFPNHGTPIRTPEGDYTVDAFNIISRTVRLVNATRDDYKTYSLEDIRAMQKGTYKKKTEQKEELDFLPNYNFGNTSFCNIEKEKTEAPNNGKKDNHGKKNKHRNGGNNHGHQERNDKNQGNRQNHNHPNSSRRDNNRPKKNNGGNERSEKKQQPQRQNHRRPFRNNKKKENKE